MLKIVLMCDGAPNQRALANKLHRVVPLTAIAVVKPPPSRKGRPFRTILNRRLQQLASVTAGITLRRAYRAMMDHFAKMFPCFPPVPISFHPGVNSPSIKALVEEIEPDLVLISGTDLVRQPLIDAINRSGRVMNLHTGISPYVKGGGCTPWCLAMGEFRLIGNTIMWLDSGIDSGAIIATERAPLSGRESVNEIYIKAMEHGHELYLRAVTRFRDGLPLPAVPQSELGEGRLFLAKHWTAAQVLRAVYNYYRHYGPATAAGDLPLRLVSMEEEDIKPKLGAPALVDPNLED